MIRFFIFLFIFTSIFNHKCYAYLDPGSGGILLQLLLGGVAGLLGIIKFYWASIKSKWKNLFGKGKN